MTSEASKHLTIIALLMAGTFLMYLSTHQGIRSGDGIFHYEQASAFASGRFELPAERVDPKVPSNRVFVKRGRDERVYLTLAPGLAASMAPLALVGASFETTAPSAPFGPGSGRMMGSPDEAEATLERFRQAPSVAAASLTNVFWGTLLVVWVYMTGLWMGATRRRAYGVALIAGFGSILWPYALTAWTHTMVACGLIGTLASLARARENVSSLVCASVCASIAVSARFDSLVWVALLYAPFLPALWRNHPRGRLVVTALPLGVTGAGLALWNAWRFGSPFETGSYHQSAGLWASDVPLGHLNNALSLNQGMLVFTPAVVVGVVGWVRMRHSCVRPAVIAALSCAFAQFAFYGAFVFWPTPQSWGPRFLVPTTALLLLGLHDPKASKGMVGAMWGCALAGLLINTTGALVPVDTDTIMGTHHAMLETELDHALATEIVIHGSRLLADGPTPWWLGTYTLTGLALTVAAAACLIEGLRRTRTTETP